MEVGSDATEQVHICVQGRSGAGGGGLSGGIGWGGGEEV